MSKDVDRRLPGLLLFLWEQGTDARLVLEHFFGDELARLCCNKSQHVLRWASEKL